MRIAILGSVALPVPPEGQGGTEWMAYYQAKGLADRGHVVTLFAAQGSKRHNQYTLVEVGGGDTAGSVPPGEADNHLFESSRLLRNETVYLAQAMDSLIKHAHFYDVILNNMRGEAMFVPLANLLGKKYVTVMHLPLFKKLAQFFTEYNTPIITISDTQRKNFPDLNYLATVHNCVDTSLYSFNAEPRDYLLMMGTIGHHKNNGAAIRVAKKLGMKLILAGKIRDQDYFDYIKPDIDGEQIRWIGELSFADKLKLYQGAKAFLFPVRWEEPFGLVMIEAMACGTPVVAFGNGAIPEVVKDKKTGYVIENNSEADMASAVKKIEKIDRKACREYVEKNFSVNNMVLSYEKALRELF